MERKPGRTATVAASELKTALSEAELTAEEEKVVRMGHGVPVDPNVPLAKAAARATHLADELLAIEVDLFRAQRRSQASQAGAKDIATAAPADARAKSKIIRALRKKR
jgi:hypothetical protein